MSKEYEIAQFIIEKTIAGEIIFSYYETHTQRYFQAKFENFTIIVYMSALLSKIQFGGASIGTFKDKWKLENILWEFKKKIEEKPINDFLKKHQIKEKIKESPQDLYKSGFFICIVLFIIYFISSLLNFKAGICIGLGMATLIYISFFKKD